MSNKNKKIHWMGSEQTREDKSIGGLGVRWADFPRSTLWRQQLKRDSGQHRRDQQVEHIYRRLMGEENGPEQETASPGGFHWNYTGIYIILGAKWAPSVPPVLGVKHRALCTPGNHHHWATLPAPSSFWQTKDREKNPWEKWKGKPQRKPIPWTTDFSSQTT